MKAHFSLLFGSLACVSANAALLADFDGNDSAYELGFFRFNPAGTSALQVTDGYLHLLDGANGDHGNYISFAATGTAGWQTASFSMDVRASAVQADGFSVGFLDTATHGTSGAVRVGSGVYADVEERGQYTNSIGVGFRTFNGTNATVNYDGAESGDAAYELPQDQWVPIVIDMTKNGDGTVSLSASSNGVTVFDNYSLAGGPDDFRVQIGGRTGGSAMSLDIDNVNLTTSSIPEPTSTLLSALGVLALAARRKR
jgi:hypothetical protein